jgi:glycosyltransferase involved in cell wall biosynthesis
MRLLYLQASPVPPPVDPSMDRFVLLSRAGLNSEVLQPIWSREPEQIENLFGPGSWPRYLRANAEYRWFLAWRWTGIRRFLRTLSFYVSEGLRTHREKPIHCVMTYSHMTTALCGVVIKVLTGAKLIVEVATSPDRSSLYNRPHPTLVDRLRHLYSDVCLHVSLWSCDCVHLLYPAQLDSYPMLRRVRRAVFHEFVPVTAVPSHAAGGDPYILLAGAPWYLKGADLLVEAFRRLAPDFPAFSLKILGHFPDGDELRSLVRGIDRIELLAARSYPETLRLIGEAAVFVLPSRCEGMGRVLLEAMASGVPVIGSNVGGIPTLIRDGENGFLFPENDAAALEAALRQLLCDSDLRNRMGARGREMAHADFSETVYVDRFLNMIQLAVNPSSALPSMRGGEATVRPVNGEK